MAGLLVKWTKVIINSNKNDTTTCPQIDNIQVDLGDIQDLNFCTHMPQIKAVWVKMVRILWRFSKTFDQKEKKIPIKIW